MQAHSPAGPRILIVGGASLDTLAGAEELVAGGAGMYTATAAWRSGASVTLFAPRPDPVPCALRQVAERLVWLGPQVSQEDLPRFETGYREGLATYDQASFGAEETLSPTLLPDDLSGFDCAHLVPLGNIRQQHELMLACRERGARRSKRWSPNPGKAWAPRTGSFSRHESAAPK